MTKKYRVRWCETVEYYTDVWASDEDQALDLFHDLPMDKALLACFVEERKMDTIQVEEQYG